MQSRIIYLRMILITKTPKLIWFKEGRQDKEVGLKEDKVAMDQDKVDLRDRVDLQDKVDRLVGRKVGIRLSESFGKE